MRPVYLFVTPFYPGPGTWRGAYSHDLVRALAATGRYEVRVFVSGRGPDYVYDGVRVHRFGEWRLPSMMFPLLFARRNGRAFLRAVVRAGVDVGDVAVCHANTACYGPYALAVRGANPRAVALLHHHFLDSYGLALGRALRRCWAHRALHFWLFRRLHARLDGHVFVSELARRSFLAVPDASWTDWADYRMQMRGLGWCPSPRIRASFVLRNGVDTARFNAAGRVRAPHAGFVMGCVANLTEGKDPLTVLRAVALARGRLGEWRLRVVGSGPLSARCRAFVRAEGLEGRVSFEGERDHARLPDFFRGLDLFVLPSRFEAFGCVFAEAWSCGTPFIACEGTGPEELIRPEDRRLWLCRPGDAADLAEKIVRFARERPVQRLAAPVAFSETLPPFLDWLESRRAALLQ